MVLLSGSGAFLTLSDTRLLCAGGRMEGETLLNGHPKVQATFSRVMGYVEQFDLHIPQVGEQACWRRGGT